jgi:hypothetical protein
MRVALGQGRGGPVQHGLGELDFRRHVGQVVLDGLEAADRLAELLALRDVVDRQVEHALGQTNQLSCGIDGPAIERCVPQPAVPSRPAKQECGIGDQSTFDRRREASMLGSGARRIA